jgi:DNA-binding NtrC family response regulator
MDVRGEVLVLDDEETVCERLQEYLTKEGFRVETFTESARALERIGEKTFDVVVTDLKMKAPTGMDVLQSIRQRDLPTEVIMITGYGSFEANREAEYSGVFEFIFKPFRMKDVAKHVAKASKKARRAGRKA